MPIKTRSVWANSAGVDVASEKVVKTFDSGRHFPRALAVFPDGKGFVSGGTDTTALVWKLDPK